MRMALVAAAVVLAPMAGAAQTASGGPIQRAVWLAGCWELRAPGRITTEMWMAPFGNVMLGASRTVIGGSMREYEYLRLGVRGDSLVYTASPSGQRTTDFASVGTNESPLVFENPAHDFPQRIIYRRVGADSLVARIEGPGANNTTRGTDFPMRRVNCADVPAPPPPPPPPPAPTDTLMFDFKPAPQGGTALLVKGWGNDWNVYVANADGTGGRPIAASPAIEYQPAWSPDGSRIAFVSTRDGHQEIYTAAPDGSGLVQLTRGAAHNSVPAWSPDGRTIAFTSERDGRPRLYLMNADGSNQRTLMPDTLASTGAAWSPDGARILFASSRTGRSEVWVVNADGTGERQLTSAATGATSQAAWSPDGSRILFWSTRDGNGDVYVMNADGSAARNITSHPAADVPLGWTRDGFILFRSNRDRQMQEIYRVRPDGTGLQRVTNTGPVR